MFLGDFTEVDYVQNPKVVAFVLGRQASGPLMHKYSLISTLGDQMRTNVTPGKGAGMGLEGTLK